MYKRRRTSNDSSAANRRAIAAAIAIRRKFPYSQYGIAHMRRGTSENVGRFGANFRTADASQRSARKTMGYYGRGGYVSDMMREGMGALSAYRMGGKVGLGAHIGSRLAASPIWDPKSKIRSDIRQLTGMGAYSGGPVSNALMDNPSSYAHVGSVMTVPDETGDIIVTNSEFIGDVTPQSLSNFQNLVQTNINPGLSTCFPWLSQIAQFYDEWIPMQIVFEFRSTVPKGNSSSSGAVCMATQYNVYNSAFSTRNQLENYDYAVSGGVNDTLIHGIECDPKKRGGPELLYCRSGAVSGTQDLKMFDVGIFQLAGANIPVGLNIGELWIRYKIKLMKTKLNPTTVAGGANYFLTSGTSAAYLVSGSYNANVTPTASSTYTIFPAFFTTASVAWSNIGQLSNVSDTLSATDPFIVSCTSGGLATFRIPVTAISYASQRFIFRCSYRFQLPASNNATGTTAWADAAAVSNATVSSFRSYASSLTLAASGDYTFFQDVLVVATATGNIASFTLQSPAFTVGASVGAHIITLKFALFSLNSVANLNM